MPDPHLGALPAAKNAPLNQGQLLDNNGSSSGEQNDDVRNEATIGAMVNGFLVPIGLANGLQKRRPG